MEFNKPTCLNVSSGNIAENFKLFKEEINIYMMATESMMKPNVVQVARLKNLMGSEALELYHSIRTTDENEETFKSVLNDLEAHCSPRKNETREMFNFFSRRQGPNESFDRFYDDLKRLIATCDFKDQEDKLLKVQLILGANSAETRERLLLEDLSLQKVVDFCKSMELEKNKKQVQGIDGDTFHLKETNSFNATKDLSDSKVSIKEEKTDETEFMCDLMNVKHEEIIFSEDDMNDTADFILKEEKDITESNYMNNSADFIKKEEKDISESNCDEIQNKVEPSQNTIHQCDDSIYKSLRSGNLKLQLMSQHTGEKPYKCPDCDYQATQFSHLKRHVMARHTGEKPYACPHCDYKSAQSYNVKTHIKYRHTGEKQFKCSHCAYEAVALSRIKRHEKACHNSNGCLKSD